MKEVIAIIRVKMVSKTKDALLNVGVPSFFAAEVMGRGKGLLAAPPRVGSGQAPLEGALRETESILESGRLFAKRMFTVVVPDELVSKVVSTIIATNRTGNKGDGKIFVLPVRNAVRVRTAESGEAAIN